ncbi:MAG TPA: hypothetical protein VGW75_04755 [Solirubrobacteraceae bacterium]|nr:hypothetical protein [Solirubrobacteraceae bacterium]
MEHASVIYSPFSVVETARLRQFVADVEELAASTFFENPGGKITIRAGIDQTLTTQFNYAGEEAVRAVVGLFRQLYSHNEPTSFHAICQLLADHVRERGSELMREALDALNEYRELERRILKGEGEIAMQMTRRHTDGTETTERLTPRLLIDLFLHGHYLHKGNAKSDKLAQWPIPDMAKHVFFGAITRLRNLWWAGRNAVRRILSCPELLNAAPAPRP